MHLRVGTSGFSYKEWKGSFYPEDLPASRMLAYYAERLRAVEINNTFYRMPKPELLEKWRSEVPQGFSFSLKAPQRITHIQRLKDSGDAVSHFFKVAEAMGPQLGPTLFQLPPNMKKDLLRLEGFVVLLPEGARCAFEFRHESWLSEDVYALLRSHGLALCIAEADDFVCPVQVTAPYAYLRLRKTEYPDEALRAWARILRSAGWDDVSVFFKHEDAGAGPRFASRLLELYETEGGRS